MAWVLGHTNRVLMRAKKSRVLRRFPGNHASELLRAPELREFIPYGEQSCCLDCTRSKRGPVTLSFGSVRRDMNEHNEHVWGFLGAAAEFCRLVEARDDFDRLTLCRRSLELLSRLVNLALALSNVEPDTTDGPPDRLSHDKWSAIFGDLGQRLGDAHGYWMVFDPYDPDDHDSIVSSFLV